MPTDGDEILRLRDKSHRLEKELWIVRELAHANHRELEELLDRFEQLAARVQAMTEADRIASEVATALRLDRRRWFNWQRRGVAALVSLILVVPAVHDLVTWIP